MSSPDLDPPDANGLWDGYPSRESRDAASRRRVSDAADAARWAAAAPCLEHSAEQTSPSRPYMGGVAVHQITAENRAAHGNITYTETCRCGATRSVNQNQRHLEFSPWR